MQHSCVTHAFVVQFREPQLCLKPGPGSANFSPDLVWFQFLIVVYIGNSKSQRLYSLSHHEQIRWVWCDLNKLIPYPYGPTEPVIKKRKENAVWITLAGDSYMEICSLLCLQWTVWGLLSRSQCSLCVCSRNSVSFGNSSIAWEQWHSASHHAFHSHWGFILLFFWKRIKYYLL